MISRGSFQAIVEAEHRDGVCEECDIPMVKVQEEPIRLGCKKCGGTKGRLIARSISIQAPPQPKCTAPRCLWKFFWDTVFSSLLSSYHTKRVRYAEKNRHKKIPLKYRTGEDAPKNVRQAIFAIIKLRR